MLLCDHGGLVLWTQATARATVHRQLDASGGPERLNIPQTLPDGVMVTTGEETRTTVATWTVLVTIDRPAILPQFCKRLEKLETFVPPQWTEPTLVPFQALWRERINQIRETWTLPMQSEVSRRKRGLLDFVGVVSNKLFGTATQAQVTELQDHVETLRQQGTRVAHAFGELVFLVNQTHGHVRENREHITSLELYAVRLQIAYRNLSDKATSQERYMTDMGRQVAVGQVLDSLEALHTTWRRGIDAWQGQRRALEAGWLTEDILPRGELGRILDAGRASGFHTPALHWYYEHVRIHALWEERGRLVFRVSLPLVDSGHYLRYTMRSWEVPSKSPGYYTQLQLPRDVAVSTDSGDLFVPQNCVGHQPAICVAGPIFSSQRYQCPRGVLTGDAQLRHTCQVTLQHRVANNTIIEEITPGQAVIVTRGEKLSLLCPREPERRSALTMGVYTLHLGPGCRAKGLGWTLLGPWSHDSKVVLIPPPLYIAPLNLSREVPPEVQRAHRLQQPAWTPLAPLENLPLIHLSEMPVLGTGWTPHGCANAIVASVALLVAFLSAFIMCRATYWPQVRPAARRLIRRAKRRR